MDKDISKKRDRSTTQRIVIRNKVKYHNPQNKLNDNPYYQASPTLVSGVYGKRRFRAVMAYGATPYAYIELERHEVSGATKALGDKLGRGVASITSSVKGLGRAYAKSNTLWLGWAYNTDKDYNPVMIDNKGRKKQTTASIIADIKSVIDAL